MILNIHQFNSINMNKYMEYNKQSRLIRYYIQIHK